MFVSLLIINKAHKPFKAVLMLYLQIMERKYTTITIAVELSKKIRQLALNSNMKTQAFLEMLVSDYENKKDEALFNEVEQDLIEMNARVSKKK